jgi:hypothetical protein
MAGFLAPVLDDFWTPLLGISDDGEELPCADSSINADNVAAVSDLDLAIVFLVRPVGVKDVRRI